MNLVLNHCSWGNFQMKKCFNISCCNAGEFHRVYIIHLQVSKFIHTCSSILIVVFEVNKLVYKSFSPKDDSFMVLLFLTIGAAHIKKAWYFSVSRLQWYLA
jgi:hypothetical protein